MAVEQDGVVAVARHLDEDQRRAAGQAHHLQGGAGEARELRPSPRHHQLDGVFHVAVLDPLGIEGRRLVGDADVLGDGGDDLPQRVHERRSLVASRFRGQLRFQVVDPPRPLGFGGQVMRFLTISSCRAISVFNSLIVEIRDFLRDSSGAMENQFLGRNSSTTIRDGPPDLLP
jgi:hypothetical protein